jgi:glycine oxidase
MTQIPQHIAIAGAGLLGRLLAWRLLLAGCKVSLFDSGAITPETPLGLRAAAFTAAGMIAPLSEAVVSDASIYRMGQFALQQWPLWFQDFPKSAEPLFYQHGSLVVAHPQDHSELLQFEQELGYVIPECNSYRHVTQTDIQALEPDLNPGLQEGLFLEEEGHLHNRELMNKLAIAIKELGGDIHEHTSVTVDNHKIIAAMRSWDADWAIDCRGTGAKDQLKQLRGVRGETLHVETTEVHLNRPVRLMHPRYQLYVVPKPNHRFIIGATQIESEDRSPISLQSTLELSSALYTLSPAFAEARIIEMDTNLRPAFMDNLPRVDVADGLITANGLFRHGYLLAPAIVENILAHIFKQPDPLFNQKLNRSN